MLVIRHFISLCFFSFTLRVHSVYRPLCRRLSWTDSNRFRTTQNNSEQLRTTPNNSEQLRATPDDSAFERLPKTPTWNDSRRLRRRTIPDDSESLRIMLSGPNFQSRFRNYRSRIGVNSGFLPTLPITRLVLPGFQKT